MSLSIPVPIIGGKTSDGTVRDSGSEPDLYILLGGGGQDLN